MAERLESLIEKIEKQAVDEAGRKAAALLDDARREAESIVREGRQQAEQLTERAQQEAEATKRTGEAALRQAARDVELQLKESITELFDRVFRRSLDGAFEPGFLKDLILTITSSWARDPTQFEISLSEQDKENLEKLLFSSATKELSETVSLYGGGGDRNKGFRLGLRDGNMYYDFTDSAIQEVLWTTVGPRLREILEGEADQSGASA
jgi:V/A-type H+-transporting ATPase subunit E